MDFNHIGMFMNGQTAEGLEPFCYITSRTHNVANYIVFDDETGIDLPDRYIEVVMNECFNIAKHLAGDTESRLMDRSVRANFGEYFNEISVEYINHALISVQCTVMLTSKSGIPFPLTFYFSDVDVAKAVYEIATKIMYSTFLNTPFVIKPASSSVANIPQNTSYSWGNYTTSQGKNFSTILTSEDKGFWDAIKDKGEGFIAIPFGGFRIAQPKKNMLFYFLPKFEDDSVDWNSKAFSIGYDFMKTHNGVTWFTAPELEAGKQYEFSGTLLAKFVKDSTYDNFNMQIVAIEMTDEERKAFDEAFPQEKSPTSKKKSNKKATPDIPF